MFSSCSWWTRECASDNLRVSHFNVNLSVRKMATYSHCRIPHLECLIIILTQIDKSTHTFPHGMLNIVPFTRFMYLRIVGRRTHLDCFDGKTYDDVWWCEFWHNLVESLLAVAKQIQCRMCLESNQPLHSAVCAHSSNAHTQTHFIGHTFFLLVEFVFIALESVDM